MERQSNNGFKFYLQKNEIPHSYMNLMQQYPLQEIPFQNSLNINENSDKKQRLISKRKMIQKDKDEIKKYDRGGNCVASNTSKLFIKILNKRLHKFPIIQNYLSYYQIYSQKQNILLIPLCLYSFLKQYEHNSLRLFHFQNPRAQRQPSKENINTRRVYFDIINQLKQHIECSLQNSRTKYKDCVNSKKQFHLKNISIYNKISQIISKIENFGLGLQNYTDQNENRMKQDQKQKFTITSSSFKNNILNSQLDIKFEEDQLHYQQSNKPVGQAVESSGKSLSQSLPIYTISSFFEPLESLYERKQREYQKAMDKVFCIILNQNPLRLLFNIYKLEIKDILLDSVNYCFRRNINSRVKKNEKILKEIYEKMEQSVLLALKIKEQGKDRSIELRGWEFLLAFLTLSLAGDKKEDIYEEFKENIRRKTKYYNIIQDSKSSDLKQSFDKQYYAYSLRLLSDTFISTKQIKKQNPENKQQLMGSLKQWMIGYFYNNTLNRILLENPRYTHNFGKGMEAIQTEMPYNTNYFHNGQLMSINPLLTEFTFEIKRQEPNLTVPNLMHPEKMVPLHRQQRRSNQFFGQREDLALQKLIQKFYEILKINAEGIA